MPSDKTTIAEALQRARAAFPMTVEFEDGRTLVINSHRDIPVGVPHRVLPDGEWMVVGRL